MAASPVFCFWWMEPGRSRSILAGVLGQNESGVDNPALAHPEVAQFQASAVAHFLVSEWLTFRLTNTF